MNATREHSIYNILLSVFFCSPFIIAAWWMIYPSDIPAVFKSNFYSIVFLITVPVGLLLFVLRVFKVIAAQKFSYALLGVSNLLFFLTCWFDPLLNKTGPMPSIIFYGLFVGMAILIDLLFISGKSSNQN